MSRTTTLSAPNISLDAISLSRALDALSNKLLSPIPSQELRQSSHERTKTAANLEYTRTLLLRLEHQATKERIQSRKQAQQGKLAEQRKLVKQLTDKLYELGQQENGTLKGSKETTEQEVDPLILRLIGESAPSIKIAQEESDDTPPLDTNNEPASATSTTPFQSSPTAPSSTTDSHLRSRRALLGPSSSTAAPSSTTTSFAATSASHSKDTDGADAPTAALLQSADSTHAQLTTSLLSLATALKSSAKQFQDDLTADSEAVRRTEAALGKNTDSLDQATSRMGVLSKMSEGRWWWGRMLLYAIIGALWVVALLIVFVGPKIRL